MLKFRWETEFKETEIGDNLMNKSVRKTRRLDYA